MDNEQHDRLLIERVKVDDHQAFRQLIEKYKDEALTLANSILKDYDLAEDVVQETFIKVYAKIKTFKYQSAFYTWLYRIVVNRSYNELRKLKRKKVELQESMSFSDEISELTLVKDRKMVINKALSQLKPDETLVLRLFYLSELKIDEVIEVTGFSSSKVKVTLHRARKHLADILEKYFGKEIEGL